MMKMCSMNWLKVLPMIDKMFILNDTAKNDPAVQIALANYIKQLNQEEQRRQAIRAGIVTSQPTQVWNISDRD